MASLAPLTLVLGGARSGKSAFAEKLVTGAASQWLYLATADTGDSSDDAEMHQRIVHHQARRGAGWTTVEEPLALAQSLQELARGDRPILVDCLTLWLTNLMMAGRDIIKECDALCEVLPVSGPVVMVSNEVGLGIVPDNAMARQFRDYVGRLHQNVAVRADTVYFTAAGLPLKMKG